MRLVACSALLAAGCNSIFGLNDNAKLDPGDGPVLIDGELPTFKLNYLLADTEVVLPGGDNQPAAPAAIAMDDATGVKIGLLNGELVEAPYNATTGDVSVPIDVTDQTWRLRFTISGVDHEVQWKPNLVGATMIEPILGRRAVVNPPADSGYNIKPTGAGAPPVAGFTDARVFTTGAFVDLRPGTSPSSTEFDAASTTAVGPIGSPDMLFGDSATLVDYKQPVGVCRAGVSGYAHFQPPALAEGSNVNVTPVWQVLGTTTHSFEVANTGAENNRLVGALEGRLDASGIFSAIELGFSAAGIEHALIAERPVLVPTLPAIRVTGPHMLMLVQCPLDQPVSSNFVKPSQLEKFPLLTHGLITNARIVNGAELRSSIVSVSTTTSPTSTTSPVDFRAPLAKGPILLTSVDAVAHPLSTADGEPLPSVALPFALTFNLELNSMGLMSEVNQFEIAIFQITTGRLTKKRVFVTTNVGITPARELETPIPIDLSGLSGGVYVMSIRSIAGTPNVAAGDFATVTSPFAASTIFTNTFTIP